MIFRKVHSLVLPFALLAASPAPAEMIHLMARKGDAAKVIAQIDKGVPVDLPSTKNTTVPGVTPLYVAAQFGKVEVVEALLAAGADVNSKGEAHSGLESHGTALHVAASWGQTDVVKVLLAAGADPTSPDHYLGPPLHVARDRDRQEIVDLLLAAGVPERIDAPSIADKLAAADIENGKKYQGTCNFCHQLRPEDPPSERGPLLWGVVGRQMASVAGFDYSAALRARGEVWDYDALNSFLASPYEYLPGTKMSLVGIEDDQLRADVIAFLRNLSDDPVPLP